MSAAIDRERPGLLTIKAMADVDEHVFIRLDSPGRPTLSIDVTNSHGRRTLGLRVNGMTVASLLADVEELDTAGDGTRLHRFCPYCGEERDVFASVDRHAC